ncbi:unnamed protein product [Macrosiphum euphorbiae]|uniref:Transmembrane protein n=1 Tax=Macrosiphum euphorbiae TaxID=13131 RepID=A0AAV0XMV1_9HEMI|nr:unnamed protein product [Macrosiphum euphorbiae]
MHVGYKVPLFNRRRTIFNRNFTFNGLGFLLIVLPNLIIFTFGGRDIESSRIESDRCYKSSNKRPAVKAAEDSISPRTMKLSEHFSRRQFLKKLRNVVAR